MASLRFFTILLLLLLPLAAIPQSASDAASTPAPWVTGHDHRDPALHRNLASGLVETDWEPLGGDAVHMSGAHALEIRAGTLFVAAFGDMWSASGGLYVFDVTTDPADPRLLGQIHGLGPMGGDRSMDATIDGDFVVVGTEATPAGYTKTGIVNPTPSGLLLIDVRDKTLPLIVGYAPAAGAHSVAIHRIGGTDYAFISDLLGTPYDIFRIVREPVPAIEPVRSLNLRHDMSIADDPALGKPLLYAAEGWRNELRVYDVSAPDTRALLGTWKFPASLDEDYYAHSALSWWTEGRRIVLITSEHAGTEPTPAWFLDATDLGNIRRLSTWTPPVGGGPGLVFSLHNPRYEDGLLYFAHYHAGVVVLDVSTLANIANPPVVAYAVPAHDTGYRSPLDTPQRAAGIDAIHYPRVYDVAVHPSADIVYAADVFSGLYAYRLDR